jgi:hypothetical protein
MRALTVLASDGAFLAMVWREGLPVLLWLGLILLALWVLGFLVFHLGALIHLALLAAVVAIVWHWVAGRSAAR